MLCNSSITNYFGTFFLPIQTRNLKKKSFWELRLYCVSCRRRNVYKKEYNKYWFMIKENKSNNNKEQSIRNGHDPAFSNFITIISDVCWFLRLMFTLQLSHPNKSINSKRLLNRQYLLATRHIFYYTQHFWLQRIRKFTLFQRKCFGRQLFR